MLSLECDLRVLGEASSVANGADLVGTEQPEVAVVELQLPNGGSDGLELNTRIAEIVPSTRYPLLTSHARPGYLKQALAQGVLTFLPETTSAAQFAAAVRDVAAGRRAIDAETISSSDSPHTLREADVLEFAADVAPIEQTARRAYLPEGIVCNYLSSAQA